MGSTAQHEALCETLIGRPCNCPARVLKRVVGHRLVEGREYIVKHPNGLPPAPAASLALAKAWGRIHELEWQLAEKTKDFQTRDQQLTEARLETRRVEEKLAFTQRALDLHTRHCERQLPPPLPTRKP